MKRQILALVLLAVVPAFAQQNAALRIVVVEGEDAVNIVQQKTAVRPLVEVRDRNNLPVSGVVVTFSIEGGTAASFGGASTLTVATNAAGQAAVTGLTPTAAGAVQINVSAAFQGQIATATITQTNVMTAAQAAAASTAGTTGTSGTAGTAGTSSGAAASGGGGVSMTTIGIAGAAVAGGAVAATQLAPQGDDVYTGSFTGTLTSTIESRPILNTCVITRNVTATMKVTLESTEGQIRGRAEIEGTDTVVSATCPANQTGTFRENADVSGTPAAFGFRVTRSSTSPDPLDGGTIQSTSVVVFEAALSGDTITGVLRFNENSTKTGPTSNTEATVGTFPISLRRAQ